MLVTQVYSLLNTVTQEVLGESAVVAEDLSNVVDIGTAVFNAQAVDNYVKSMVDHIGRVVFVNRPYSGNLVSLLREGWEFGSVLEKIQMDLPQAKINESWKLTNGTSYDPNVFTQPTITATFFNKRVTFEVDMSITEKQVKESFSSAAQMNAFVSMIYSAIDKSMTVKIDGALMRLVNNMIGETFYSEQPSGTYTGVTGLKAVNLLYEYNTEFTQTLTASEALHTPEFIRYASYKMGLYTDRLTRMSTLFNIKGKERFTPKDLLHVVLLSEFDKAASAYLQSDTYHDMYTALPKAEIVPYWQGSGTDYAFTSTGAINIKTASGHDVEPTGIIGVMFDHDCIMACNEDRRTTTNYNPKAEFWNQFAKWDMDLYSDTAENFVVFYVA